MRFKVDTSSTEHVVVSPVEQVMNFGDKQPRVDSNGQAMFAFNVVALGDEGAEIMKVKVSGEPKGLTVGVKVALVGLVATTWEMGDHRHGVSFRADRVEVLSGPVNKASPSA